MPPEEVIRGVRALEHACLAVLGSDPEADELEREIRNSIVNAIEFGVDRILETHEDH